MYTLAVGQTASCSSLEGCTNALADMHWSFVESIHIM